MRMYMPNRLLPSERVTFVSGQSMDLSMRVYAAGERGATELPCDERLGEGEEGEAELFATCTRSEGARCPGEARCGAAPSCALASCALAKCGYAPLGSAIGSAIVSALGSDLESSR